MLKEAVAKSTHGDCFDLHGYLPELYGKLGFRPVARVSFNKDYAPKGWDDKLMDSPSVVFMVKDTQNKLKLPDMSKGYSKVKIPYETYDYARAKQERSVEELSTSKIETSSIGISEQPADDEGKGWTWHYATDKATGGVRGRMLLSPEPNNTVGVRLIDIASTHQGRGYGTIMLNHAVQVAKDRGASAIMSDPEGGIKPKAESLFKKLGATKIPMKSAPEGYVYKLNLDNETRGEGTTPGGWAKTPVPEHARIALEQRAQAMAGSLGFDRSKVSVLNEEPPTFELNGRVNNYAGAYHPDTGEIKVYARVVPPDTLPHIMSHEVQHDRYKFAEDILQAEHKEMIALPDAENSRIFSPSGFVRPEAMPEVEKRWPMTALWGRTWGDAYIGSNNLAGAEKMKKDDGVTPYSREYWTPEAMKKNYANSTAVNETLAEIASIKDRVGVKSQPKISKEWNELYNGIRTRYDYAKGIKPAILPRPPGIGH